MFLLSWYCERFSPFSCTINLEEKLPSNYPSLLCVAERVAISSMPGHPRFPFHFLVSFDSRGRHSLFGGVYSRDCTFSNNSRTGSPRLLRAIVSAFKSHLVEKKKKKRRETYEYPSQLNFTINENEPMVGNGWILIVDFSPLVLFIISFASCPGMQMAIVFTLGLENPNTRGIPWQTKKRPGSMTLTSHHRRVYIEGVTTWVQHCSFLSLLLSPSLFALFVSRYSCYLCRLEATFLQFNCSLLIFIC